MKWFKQKTYDTASLLEKAKRIERLKKCKLSVVTVTFVILTIQYAYHLVNHLLNKEIDTECYGIFFILTGLFVFTIPLYKTIKDVIHTDYSLPVIEQLRVIANLYKLFPNKTIIIFVPISVLLINTGMWLKYSETYDLGSFIINDFIKIFYIGFIMVMIMRYIRFKPIRTSVLQLIKELGE